MDSVVPEDNYKERELMTKEKLEQVYHLNKELKMWERRLSELEADIAISASAPTGMPYSKTNSTGNPTERKAMKLIEANRNIRKQIRKIEKAKCEVEQYILTLDDPELRMIIEYRCVYNLSWKAIGNILNWHRSTVEKKYLSFIKKLQK